MSLNWPAKDPDEVLDYFVDWAARLAGDTIDTVVWIVPSGLTKNSESRDGARTTIWLAGGQPASVYQVTCRITTAGGRTMEETIVIRTTGASGTLCVIGGVSVDVNDPCALYQALYSAKLKLIAGERLEEVEVQSPATRRRIRVAASNIAAIDGELMRLQAACEAKSGRRSRYAKGIRFTGC